MIKTNLNEIDPLIDRKRIEQIPRYVEYNGENMLLHFDLYQVERYNVEVHDPRNLDVYIFESYIDAKSFVTKL